MKYLSYFVKYKLKLPTSGNHFTEALQLSKNLCFFSIIKYDSYNKNLTL